MKLKKVMALTMAALLTFSVVGCGQKTTGNSNEVSNAEGTSVAQTNKESEAQGSETTGLEDGGLNYADIVLGESFTDVTATLKVLSHRTDLEDTKFPEYVAAFNEMYPNITVEYEASTTYADEALLRIKQSDWDIMMIPAVDKAELSTYFIPYGNLGTMELLVRFANTWLYEDIVYGVPSTGNAQGVLYNKAVFEEAGITELPKTPDAFIDALKAIKEKTDATPLYTNYAAEWTMGAWDAYIGGSATSDSAYMNQVLIHDPAPFADKGDDTHAYAVYKILYDAVAEGLTEDDYTTTDWEGSKGMLNRGEIGCMVLGSWAYTQMQEAGDTPENVGYMSFPITVNGDQFASAGADYSYGINAQSSEDNQKAAMVYVKWLTEKSGFSYSEGGIPIAMDGEYPELYAAFDGIDFIPDDAALPGEETLKNALNAESELMVNDGGNKKIMELIEHADKGDMTFDEIMESWNKAWNDAQIELGVETK